MTTQPGKLRIFLDANILFSAAYGSPALKRIWDDAAQGRYELLASHYVVEEARRNLSTAHQGIALKNCLLHVKIVPEADPSIACPIPLPEKDRPVLMAAIMARADLLVTGDVLHFGPFFGKKIQNVMICRLRDLKI
ncbi:MAG: PIN domain-containing protein [Deltaproteobacteria bacterium]